MSASPNLPVYRDVFRLAKMILKEMENAPVKHRRVLGDRMIDASCALLDHLHSAIGAQQAADKVRHIDEFRTKFNFLQTYVRLAYDCGVIHLKASTNITELTVGISKQIAGWRKSILK